MILKDCQNYRMLNKTSNEFRKSFLLLFTKELINNHSPPDDLFKLKQWVNENLREKTREKNKVKKHILNKKKISQISTKTILSVKKKSPQVKKELNIIEKPILIKKEIRFPEYKKITPQKNLLQKPIIKPQFISERIQKPPILRKQEPIGIIPTPNPQLDIELGKLDDLIKDPFVQKIEYEGEGKNLIVIGGMGRKKTKIILNKEEINEILNKFSETTKIPLHEGIYNIAYGNLIFTATLSNLICLKFEIKKIPHSKISQIPLNRL